MNSEIKQRFEAMAKELGISNPRLTEEETSEFGFEYFLEDADTNKGWASACLSHFPGCCGIAILHDFGGDRKFMRLMFDMRIEIAKSWSKGLAMQTDVSDRRSTLEMMKALKFHKVESAFFNPNSGNRVSVWAKQIASE